MANLSEQLRAALKASGKTQAQVCRETGLSTSRLANYMTGHRSPDPGTLDRLAAVLGTDAETLTGASVSLSQALAAILAMLLQLDGLSPQRSAAIGETAVEALRILKALPSDDDLERRCRLAAQAAWQSRGPSTRRQ